MGLQRVRHDWATFTSIFSHTWDSDIAVCVFTASCVWFFVTPWTVAHQVPLFMGFSRQEYWSVLPFPFPGDLLTQEMDRWHHQFMDMNLGKLWEMVRDRKAWYAAVYGVTKSWIWLDIWEQVSQKLKFVTSDPALLATLARNLLMNVTHLKDQWPPGFGNFPQLNLNWNQDMLI